MADQRTTATLSSRFKTNKAPGFRSASSSTGGNSADITPGAGDAAGRANPAFRAAGNGFASASVDGGGQAEASPSTGPVGTAEGLADAVSGFTAHDAIGTVVGLATNPAIGKALSWGLDQVFGTNDDDPAAAANTGPTGTSNAVADADSMDSGSEGAVGGGANNAGSMGGSGPGADASGIGDGGGDDTGGVGAGDDSGGGNGSEESGFRHGGLIAEGMKGVVPVPGQAGQVPNAQPQMPVADRPMGAPGAIPYDQMSQQTGAMPPQQGGFEGLVQGPGDGNDDAVQIMASNGEFMVPADAVAALGDGSTEAGAAKLTELIARVRGQQSQEVAAMPPPRMPEGAGAGMPQATTPLRFAG